MESSKEGGRRAEEEGGREREGWTESVWGGSIVRGREAKDRQEEREEEYAGDRDERRREGAGEALRVGREALASEAVMSQSRNV